MNFFQMSFGLFDSEHKVDDKKSAQGKGPKGTGKLTYRPKFANALVTAIFT